MPVIHTRILINAPRERVFDLARSVDAHQASTGDTGERAVAGVVSGLIGLNEQVTWEARHLGVRQRLTSKITQLTRPSHFRDEMLAGAFKHLCHDHTFEERDGKTLMTDRFDFSAPLGSIAERVFLTAYMRRFIEERNAILRRMAESNEWKQYLT